MRPLEGDYPPPSPPLCYNLPAHWLTGVKRLLRVLSTPFAAQPIVNAPFIGFYPTLWTNRCRNRDFRSELDAKSAAVEFLTYELVLNINV